MAAAQAAAAALAAMKTQKQKELDTGLKVVGVLQEVGIDTFMGDLALLAHNYGWPAWIMDLQLPENQVPGDVRRNVRDEDNNQVAVPALTDENRFDVKNAFMIICTKCKGHPVAYALEDVALGDARAAYRAVYEHHFRSSQAGKQAAIANLYGMTQANTDTTIGAFLALVERRSRAVVKNGPGEWQRGGRRSQDDDHPPRPAVPSL